MADAYLGLAPDDRREVLAIAADASGRPVHLLEKDIWVVWALSVLFSDPLGDHLVFKGGTSLSKGYGAIRRFSEDIDLTFDIRRLAPDLAGEAGEALPPNQSQSRKWTKAVSERLPAWVGDEAAPLVERALATAEPAGAIRIDGTDLYIRYAPVGATSDYVRPEVKLEFGARATGEPNARRPIACDAAPYVEGIVFPAAEPRVMLAERTFWEKATAAHVFCRQGRLRGDRFARHWYDLQRLDEIGLADAALARRDIATAVATHKAMFFRERDTEGAWIDYGAAVGGALRLVPPPECYAVLAEDYRRMVTDGLFLDDPMPFEALMADLEALEQKANDGPSPGAVSSA